MLVAMVAELGRARVCTKCKDSLLKSIKSMNKLISAAADPAVQSVHVGFRVKAIQRPASLTEKKLKELKERTSPGVTGKLLNSDWTLCMC